MSELWKGLGDTLKALAHTPVSLFLAVFLIGLVVLYGPEVPGLGLEVVRSKAGPWIGLITLSAGVFAVVRTLAFIGHSSAKLFAAWLESRAPRTRPSLLITLNSHMASATWGQAKQQDGSIVTQIMVDFFAHNHANQVIYLRAARLIFPRVRLQDTLPSLLTLSDPQGGRTHSPNHPILSGGEATGRVVLMVRRALGRPGKFLRVVIGLKDQTGHEYRVRAKLWSMPEPTPTLAPPPVV